MGSMRPQRIDARYAHPGGKGADGPGPHLNKVHNVQR